MGQFRIIESQSSLSSGGPNVQGNISTDTGAGMMARAMGELGSSVAQLGIGLFVAQGQAELAGKMAEAKGKISKMHLDLEKETDPERYQQIFEETWSDVEATEVKNGWASREWKLALPDLKVAQQEAVGISQRQRVRENHTTALANAKADWLANPTGDGAKYKNLLSMQVSQRWIDPVEADTELKKTQEDVKKKLHEVRRREVELVVLGPNPEVFLKKYKTAQDLLKDYPDLEPGDFNDLSNLAVGQQRALKAEQTKLTAAIIDDTLKKAQTMSLTEFREQLRQTQGITEVDKTKLLETFIGGQKLWQDTGENPFTVTRDWPSFWRARDAIYRGLVTTRQQLLELQLSDPKNGTLWSNVQFNDLVTDLPSEDVTGFSSDPVVKGYLGNFRALYAKPSEDIPKDKLEEYAPAYGELVDALKAKYKIKDYRGMHDEFDRVTNRAKKQKVIGIIESYRMAWEEGFWAEGAMHRIRRFSRMAEKGEVIDIKTENERQAVPEGAYYRFEGKVYKKKS